MNKIKVSVPVVGKEELKGLKDVLFSGMYVQDKTVKKFEEQFAKYLGVKHAIAVNTGTAALHTTLASCGIGPGDEVIVPALTFFSTITSVIHQNAVPVLVDIELDDYCMSPEDFRNRITKRTKAVIPVHLYGQPAKMDEIRQIASEHDILVIEDCAQAHGAEYRDKKTGSLGDAGCFSFFATKNMTTGEGGMITTDSDRINKLSRQIRNHGMTNRNTHSVLGYNYRMNEFSAAMGLAQLQKLDSFNRKRTQNSTYLWKNLKDIDWLKIPKTKPHTKHAFFWCPIQIDEDKLGMTTSKLREKLLKRGVETRHRYYEPLNRQKMLLRRNFYPKECPVSCPFYSNNIDYSRQSYPNTEKVAGKMIGLPNHPKLKDNDLKRIIKIFYRIKETK